MVQGVCTTREMDGTEDYRRGWGACEGLEPERSITYVAESKVSVYKPKARCHSIKLHESTTNVLWPITTVLYPKATAGRLTLES